MGLLLGLACGAAFASIHALATVTFKIDHIVSGVVINLVAVGLARFLSTVFFGQATQSDPGQPHLHVISIPLLSSIPAFGRAFQGLSPFVLFPFLDRLPGVVGAEPNPLGTAAPLGGENPEATRSLGVAVAPLRWEGVPISGAFAGLAGAFLSVEIVNNWREGQTLGLGFIALAALILSNWNPIRLMGAAFLFGFAQAIPLALRDWPIIRSIPEQFVNMTPYVVTIVVLAGFIGRVRPPAAAGQGVRGNDDLDRAVEPVAEVAEARQDEALLVELAIEGGREDRDVGMVGREPLDALGGGDHADERDRSGGGVRLDVGERRRAASAGREHRIEHERPASVHRRELRVVVARLERDLIALHAEVAHDGVRVQVGGGVEEPEARPEDGDRDEPLGDDLSGRRLQGWGRRPARSPGRGSPPGRAASPVAA